MSSPAVLPVTPDPTGAYYGTSGGMDCYARETGPGRWQVERHDPDRGWVLLGTGWPTLAAARAATGLA